jgi:hypothetical protein
MSIPALHDVHLEGDLVVITVENATVDDPAWTEIVDPWWVRLVRWVIRQPRTRTYYRRVPWAKVPCTVCDSDDAAWCQQAGHYNHPVYPREGWDG